MNLKLILEQLRPGHPDRQTAGRELFSWVQQAVRGQPVHVREDVAGQVVYTLVRRAHSGVADPEDPERYVGKMIRNASLTLLRKAAALRPLDELGDPAAVPDQTRELASLERELAQEEARARALLRELFAELRERALPRYRQEWTRTFRQLEELVFDGRDLPELVRDGEGPSADDEAAAQAALGRAYTAHRRLRDRLAETVEVLRGEGKLSEAKAGTMRACLGLLIRTGVRRNNPGTLERRGPQASL